MLVFIVPLQSPQASRDWPRVSRLANRTVASLLRQQHPDFRVVLVCTEPPIECPVHDKLTIVQCPFREDNPGTNRTPRMADKWRKVRVGLAASRHLAPCHFMVTDADDCVSNRLASLVARREDSAGWIFARGWMHDAGSRVVYKETRDFDQICGTSSIVRAECSELPLDPADPTDDAHDTFIARAGHTRIRSYMNQRGTPLEELPFFGSVYNLDTGENDSGFSLRRWHSKRILLRKLLRYRPLTDRIRDEFGLYEIE